jgi:pantoate--beta-alanine ligase
MKTVQTIPELRKILAEYRLKGAEIGFVPTMGALHPGHISLIKRARDENSVVICSIFVNPSQFNDPQDLARYPRTPGPDRELLVHAGCDLVFMPSVEEMYPPGEKPVANPQVDLGTLVKVMEGRLRPGHFEGVVQIVSKLFQCVDPDRSYFGQKDFQQVAVIREMVKQMNFHTSIIACPTLRESDGLAMSSRNVLLDTESRKLAPVIYQTLKEVHEMSFTKPVDQLLSYALSRLQNVPGLTLDYFEIADSNTLQPIYNLNGSVSAVACVAVKLGKVRLIDNMILR